MILLGPEEVADCEGDAQEIRRFAGYVVGDLPSMGELAFGVTGYAPRFAFLFQESKLTPAGEILIRHGTSPERAAWLIGHELAEWWYRKIGYREPDRESRCDSVGAMIACPRFAFKEAIRNNGHHVHDLAECFGVPQRLALARLGEVSGRSTICYRRDGDIVRGEPYMWPAWTYPFPVFPRSLMHPIRVDDGWGMMAV